MTENFSRAQEIVRILVDAGHEAYFAGGCVRDRLLEKEPKDYDIATSARPDEVEKLFRNTIGVGRQFGVIIVVRGGVNYDVATFRADGQYGNGRHPDRIEFSSSREDVLRRDFTINGLLMDPLSGEIIDHVGGQKDLEAGVVRTIGDAATRFGEDHLRILRAVRFACRLGFEVDEETQRAIRRMAEKAAMPSAERIFGELNRMLTENAPQRAVRLLDRLGLLGVVLPEVAAVWHRPLPGRLVQGDTFEPTWEDRKETILARLGAAESALPWAVLLGDLDGSSPVADGKAAAAVLKRLRAANELIDTVRRLVVSRDRLLFACRVSQARWVLAAADPLLEVLWRFRDVEASFVDDACLVPRHAHPQSRPLPRPLLDGRVLMGLGVPPGRGLGRLMKKLRFLQLDGRLLDEQSARQWVMSQLSD